MRKKWIIEIISGLFIILFLYTALSKLTDYKTFRDGLAGSPPLFPFRNFLAWFIPITEIGITGMLFFPPTRKIGLYASALIMIVFTGYITYMVYFTEIRPCSCGGVIAAMTWKQHLVFNISFVILAFIAIMLNSSKEKTSSLKNIKLKTT